jgi:hypothetical protein
MVTAEVVARLREHPRFPRLELDQADVDALFEEGRPKHYARFVTELFDLHGAVKGKRLVGEKTPHYVLDLPTLHELWPDVRIVHLIRDGRDVALSFLEWSRAQPHLNSPPWVEDKVITSALYWERFVRVGREARAFLAPERYLELRYESLVADPERECRRLCAFLQLDYVPAMLRFHEGRVNSEPGRSAKKAWLPITAGLRRWRDQMMSRDLARFEAAAGSLLEELGYARGSSSSSVEDLQLAARMRDEVVARVESRGKAVPSAWQKVP